MGKKCECGLYYVPENPDDAEYHARLHAEYSDGPEIEAVLQLRVIGEHDGRLVCVIDHTCPKSIRSEFAHVAQVASRSCQFPAGYDGSDPESRMYVIANGIRVVAMIIVASEKRFWRGTWTTEEEYELFCEPAILRKGFKIARAWTAASCQRTGLASKLVEIASALLLCDISLIGWELPFTSSGVKLAKRLCPHEFLGCGDPSFLSHFFQTKSS